MGKFSDNIYELGTWQLMQPELNMIEDFESKIRDTIEYLPPIPLVMTELIQALSDDIDLNDLGKIISKTHR